MGWLVLVLLGCGGKTEGDSADGGGTSSPVTEDDGTSEPTTSTVDTTPGTSTGTTDSVAFGEPPMATDDLYRAAEDTVLDVKAPGVLTNDIDPDGDQLTVVVESAPSSGAVTLDPDGGFRYTPSADFNGEDAFVYRAENGFSYALATVNLVVDPVNDPPVAEDDFYEVASGERLRAEGAEGLLANDWDLEGDPLEAFVDGAFFPMNGVWFFLQDGSLEYTSDPGFTGEEVLSYRASDGTDQSEQARVTIRVR